MYVATDSFRDRCYGYADWTCRKFLTNPTAVAIPGTESYWISPLNDILKVEWMKGLRLFASLSAAAAGRVTLPFALSEVAYDIRYVCVCVCGFESETNSSTLVTKLLKFVSHYYSEY
jgi:hypothetical protein